jgi:heavy metal sensor kinase
MTIRGRIMLSYTLVFGILLLAFALLVYRTLERAEIAKLDAMLESHAMKLAAEVEEQKSEGVFPSAVEFAQVRTENLAGVRFRLETLDGTLVLPDSFLGSMSARLGEKESALPTFQTVELREMPYRTATMPVEVDDRIAYRLRLAVSLAPIQATLADLRLLFFVGIPAGLFLAALAAMVITRAAFSPLSSMIATAHTISAQHLDARLPLPPVRDEIRSLGETFNLMMDRIEGAFLAQRRFIADASHELRTPLTILRSELEYLRLSQREREARRAIQSLLEEVQRLARMTEGMLLLSKLDSPQEEPAMVRMRIDEAILDSVQNVQKLFRKKGVRLNVRVQEAKEITGNPDQLRRAILNLLDNALKYTRKGGRVVVRLEVSGSETLPVRLVIEDTGRGIPSVDLPHLFKRFYRGALARAEGSGSGLGLAITSELVRRHGGTVTVRSREGKGTTVTIALPEAQDAPGRSETGEA